MECEDENMTMEEWLVCPRPYVNDPNQQPLYPKMRIIAGLDNNPSPKNGEKEEEEEEKKDKTLEKGKTFKNDHIRSTNLETDFAKHQTKLATDVEPSINQKTDKKAASENDREIDQTTEPFNEMNAVLRNRCRRTIKMREDAKRLCSRFDEACIVMIGWHKLLEILNQATDRRQPLAFHRGDLVGNAFHQLMSHIPEGAGFVRFFDDDADDDNDGEGEAKKFRLASKKINPVADTFIGPRNLFEEKDEEEEAENNPKNGNDSHDQRNQARNRTQKETEKEREKELPPSPSPFDKKQLRSLLDFLRTNYSFVASGLTMNLPLTYGVLISEANIPNHYARTMSSHKHSLTEFRRFHNFLGIGDGRGADLNFCIATPEEASIIFRPPSNILSSSISSSSSPAIMPLPGSTSDSSSSQNSITSTKNLELTTIRGDKLSKRCIHALNPSLQLWNPEDFMYKRFFSKHDRVWHVCYESDIRPHIPDPHVYIQTNIEICVDVLIPC